MEQVQTGSIAEYRQQMTKTKKKRVETNFQKKMRKKGASVSMDYRVMYWGVLR